MISLFAVGAYFPLVSMMPKKAKEGPGYYGDYRCYLTTTTATTTTTTTTTATTATATTATTTTTTLLLTSTTTAVGFCFTLWFLRLLGLDYRGLK